MARLRRSWPSSTISPAAFNSQNWKVRSLRSSPMVVDGIVAMVVFFMAGPLLHRVSECVFSFTSELNAADEGPARSSYLNQHTDLLILLAVELWHWGP